jgi:TonB-linked SusC/RagA family outer membrane protein
MRLIINIKDKMRIAAFLFLVLFNCLPAIAQAQKEKKARQLFDVPLKVLDEGGNPIQGVSVVVGEGILHVKTNATGAVTFKGYADDAVTITSPLFDKRVSTVIDLVQNPTVTLLKGKVQMTSGDDLPLPFKNLKKRYDTGPNSVIDGSYFEKYPSTDLRNVFSGMTSLWDVRENDGSPGLSSMEGLQNYQGLTNSYGATDKFSNVPYILIDNMPADLQEMNIDPAEIESATLIKGILATTMYGPAATGGVLKIKTKYGAKNERLLAVDIERGIEVIDRMPEYVSGSVYARLQNLARQNSGITTMPYSSEAISYFADNESKDYKTAYTDPNYLKYPNADWQSILLKNTMPITRVGLSSSGGNDVVQYFSYIGYAGEGDIINIGAKSDYNRIIAHQNVNVKVSDALCVSFSFYGNLNFRRSPNYGYSSNYTTEGTANTTLTLTEVPTILNDLHTIPSVAFPIWANYDSTAMNPWYGVASSTFTQNPIGNTVGNGYYTDRGRTGASNINLAYDMDKLVKGLKSNTYFGFNLHNLVRIGKANDYSAYTSTVNTTVTPATITRTRSSSHTISQMADLYKLMDYYYQRYQFYQEFSYEKTIGDSRIQSDVTYHQLLTYLNGIEEPQRQRSIVWSGTYSFKDKYIFQGVFNYAGTSSFDVDYRSKPFGSVGASWVASDEGFMQNVKFINYLKFRTQYGIVGNETYFPNLYYVDRWSTSSGDASYFFGPQGTSSTQWFGSTTEASVLRTYLSRTGNPILTWETRKEFNTGFDAQFLNNKLAVQATYYNWLVDGAITQVANSLPFVAGYNGARPYINFSNTRYQAGTLDVQYSENLGDFSFSIGGNATTMKGIRKRYDEPNYRFDYQKRTGQPSDAIFGLKYVGKFATDLDARGGNGNAVQMYDALGTLTAGDLQYADMNSDGVIDDNDQTMIGHTSPRLFYGLQLSLGYKNFELFVSGNGRAFYDIALTNSYYWNGWGDNTYSKFVADNIGEAYPRLTYNKINNNFVTSNFWLTKGDYFKIQNVELAYNIPAKALQFFGGRSVKVYVRGANLLTITKVKDVDPENINSGVSVYPLFRTFTGGIKFNF